MKKSMKYIALAVLVSIISSCSGGATALSSSAASSSDAASVVEQVGTANIVETSSTNIGTVEVVYDAEDLESSSERAGMSEIRLLGDSISVEGNGAQVTDSTVTITAAGDYRISGTLTDGQVIVDTQDEATVFLLFAGVDIQSADNAPIYIRNADKVVLTLVDGTENSVSDGEGRVSSEGEEADAAIFSNDDLTINGNGALVVEANYSHGIKSEDDLKIVSGTIEIDAVDDGIKGRDSIAIQDGSITVVAGADALQADNEEDADKGYVVIEGGRLDLTSGLDGIQAETQLVITDGEIQIVTGGGAPETVAAFEGGMPGEFNTNDSGESVKGLKAGVDLTINGGSIQVDALDDALHSDGSMTIAGGVLLLASGDDGLHAESTLTIQGSDLQITRSYEGIEAADITITAGTIHVVSSDDGLNGSSGNGGGMDAGPAVGGFFETGDNSLLIEGGYLVVDALGDGIDINGPITMTDGVVIVVGPTSNGNGALDYGGAFDISGGYFIAVGSSGMAEAPSESSSQYSLMYNYTSIQPAGTAVHIESTTGEDLLTFVPWREYASVVFSSPDIQNGVSYNIYSGGSSSGEVNDGLYSGGSYSAGQQLVSFDVSSIVTVLGASGGGFPGGAGGPGGNRGGQPPGSP